VGGSRCDLISDITLSSADSPWKTSQLISGLRCKAGTFENKTNMFSTWPHLVFLLLIPPQHSYSLGKCGIKWWRQHSVVTSVTRLRAGWSGFKSLQEEEIYHFCKTYRLALGHTTPGHEANHSPPSSAEVKTEWPSLPLYAFTVCIATNLIMWLEMTILFTPLRLQDYMQWMTVKFMKNKSERSKSGHSVISGTNLASGWLESGKQENPQSR